MKSDNEEAAQINSHFIRWMKIEKSDNLQLKLVKIYSESQKADSISRWDMLSRSEMMITNESKSYINCILKTFPDVDVFANEHTVISNLDNTPLEYVADHKSPSAPKNCIAVNFWSQCWKSFDKTKLLWCFPPDHVAQKALRTLLDAQVPALICVHYRVNSVYKKKKSMLLVKNKSSTPIFSTKYLCTTSRMISSCTLLHLTGFPSANQNELRYATLLTQKTS